MRAYRPLWIVTLDTLPSHSDSLATLIGERAVSQTILSPPKALRAIIEVIFDFEPVLGEITALLNVYSAVMGVPISKPSLRPAPKLDWLKKVAEDFPPMTIGGWTVHGAYHRKAVPNRLKALQIDATSAFGTGGHPSTQGCLLMLHKLLKSGFKPFKVADIGCGSGILSLACAKGGRQAGFLKAVAVDLDPDCVQIAARNVNVNGALGKIQVRRSRGYAAPALAHWAPYDLILTNLFTRPLCQMARDVRRSLRPGGHAILSGILHYDAKRIIAAHRMQSLALVEHFKISDWSVLAFRR